MDTLWSDLHELLKHQAALPGTRDVLRRAQDEHPVLRPFGDVEALVAFLQGEGDATRKDTILASLIRLRKMRWARRLTETLLLLALWPGLEGVLRRRRRLFQGREGEAVSSIIACLLALLDGVDLWRVNRVAATLIKSTDREVCAEALRRDDAGQIPPRVVEPATPATEPLGPILRWLDRTVGDDAELVFATVVQGYSAKDVASALGISSSAVRKRLERAKARLRDEWSDRFTSNRPALAEAEAA